MFTTGNAVNNWKPIFVISATMLLTNITFLSFSQTSKLPKIAYKVLSLIGVIPIKEIETLNLGCYLSIILISLWLQPEKITESTNDTQQEQTQYDDEYFKTKQNNIEESKNIFDGFLCFIDFWKLIQNKNCSNSHFFKSLEENINIHNISNNFNNLNSEENNQIFVQNRKTRINKLSLKDSTLSDFIQHSEQIMEKYKDEENNKSNKNSQFFKQSEKLNKFLQNIQFKHFDFKFVSLETIWQQFYNLNERLFINNDNNLVLTETIKLKFAKFRLTNYNHTNYICNFCLQKYYKENNLSQELLNKIQSLEQDLIFYKKNRVQIYLKYLKRVIIQIYSNIIYEITIFTLLLVVMLQSNLLSLFYLFLTFILIFSSKVFYSKNFSVKPSKKHKWFYYFLKVLAIIIMLIIFGKMIFYNVVRIYPDLFNRNKITESLCKKTNRSTNLVMKQNDLKKIDFNKDALIQAFKKLKEKTKNDISIDKLDQDNKQKLLQELREFEHKQCQIDYSAWLSLYSINDYQHFNLNNDISKHKSFVLEQEEEYYDNFVSTFFEWLGVTLANLFGITESKLTSLGLKTSIKDTQTEFENSIDLIKMNILTQHKNSYKISPYYYELVLDIGAFVIFCLLIHSFANNIHLQKNLIKTHTIINNHKIIYSKKFLHFKLLSDLKYIICFYFYNICIFLMILIGISGGLSPKTNDIISFCYVFMGVFLMINGKVQNNTYKESFLQISNLIVLVILIIFQSPWFGCPFMPKGRQYVSSEECHFFRMLDSQMDGGKSFASSSQYFMISTLGLEKNHGQFIPSLKCILICLLSIFFTLQRYLWNTNYYFDNIAEKLKNHHQNSIYSAIRFILNYFETKNWVYQQKKITSEIHLHRISDLDKKIAQIKGQIILSGGDQFANKQEQKSKSKLKQKSCINNKTLKNSLSVNKLYSSTSLNEKKYL